MTNARTNTTSKTPSASGAERRVDALSWVARQQRFEQLLGSLEGRVDRQS